MSRSAVLVGNQILKKLLGSPLLWELEEKDFKGMDNFVHEICYCFDNDSPELQVVDTVLLLEDALGELIITRPEK